MKQKNTKTPKIQDIQGDTYVPVLQIEIIKLLIFGQEYKNKLRMSSEHLKILHDFKKLQKCGLKIEPSIPISKFQSSKLKRSRLDQMCIICASKLMKYFCRI